MKKYEKNLVHYNVDENCTAIKINNDNNILSPRDLN